MFSRIDAEVAPLREKYEALIAKPAEIEAILRDGAHRLRAQHATPLLLQLREAVGLCDLSRVSVAADVSSEKAALPLFKQYREDDGRFYFKLVDGERVLLQSAGFDAPRDAGRHLAALKRAGCLDRGDPTLRLGDGVHADEVDAALVAITAATEKG